MKKIDSRFQIFISSTFEDLKEQRKKAIEVIFERGHIPIALERFSPANESDLDVIKKVIADCQVYLLILGHRYGDIVPEKDISFTEMEYEIAEKNNLLILSFVLKEDEIIKLRKDKLDLKVERDKRESDNYNKLIKFGKRIKRFRRIWSYNDEFKYLVATALSDNLDKCKKKGFVKEPEEPTMALLASASENEFIVDIVEELKSFKKLYDRCLEQSDKKRELAHFFKEQYIDGIIDNKVSLFFESGSTVAFVAKELSDTLSDFVKIQHDGSLNIHINTNNILAYLYLWLKARIPCTTFPWNPPEEETYGASYGGLQKLESKGPNYDLSPLDEVAREEIKNLFETPYTLTSMQSPALLLGASSGLQISNKHKLKFKEGLEDITKKELESQLSKCFGPHVGSYHNKVFKRFMYDTKIPIIIFITGDKIDCEIEVGKCHFVLDSEPSWMDFCKNYPVGFCVGCLQINKKKFIEMFEKLGFHIIPGHDFAPLTTFIARNNEFIEQFEKKIQPKHFNYRS